MATETTDIEPHLQIIFDRFAAVPADYLGDAIEATLEDLADFAGASAACVREVAADRRSFATTYSWGREGAAPHAARLSEAPPPDVAAALQRGETVLREAASGSSEEPGGPDDGALLEVPLRSDAGISGSVAIARTQPTRWRRAERFLVGAAASAIGQALRRQKAEHERRQLERRLRRGERLEAVGRLAAGVAHDFNNILLAIGGFSHLAEKSEDRPLARGEAFREIDNAIGRARRLTQQLLAFSSRSPMDKTRVDLNEVVESLGSILERLVPSHIELRIDCSSSPTIMLADAGHLEQILVNLCVNARDAMPDGGALTVRTRNAAGEGPPAHDRPWVELTVEDTGVGFDDEVRAHLFDPFFTTKPEGEGTGLGLATVRELVDGYGGSIDVTSSPGTGTRFRIRLPSSADEAMPAPAGTDEGRVASGTRGRILLADDEPALLRSVAMLLQSGGHDVTTVSDGAQAIEQVERHGRNLDLVMVDVVMPKASGAQVADAAHALFPDLPVVLTTGYQDPKLERLARRKRTTVLSKPFSSHELLRLVDRLLAPAPTDDAADDGATVA